VEKKERPIKRLYCPDCGEIIAVDLPGAYSMSPFTVEESVTSEYVHNEKPDVILNIVDATNLSRSLFFTTQLLELGIPMVVALNKSDVTAKKETKIDAAVLSAKLGCPVVETVASAAGDKGLVEVVQTAVALFGKGQAVAGGSRGQIAVIFLVVEGVVALCVNGNFQNCHGIIWPQGGNTS
jgi:ferrous iron transport protein B